MILASGSPRRRELLRKLTSDFSVETAAVEEAQSGASPEWLPQRNAEAKAIEVSRRHPDALVLGADTAIIFAGQLLGKPADLTAAHAMLRAFSGRSHRVITAIALASGGQLETSWSEVAEVRFRHLTDADITAYLRAVNVLDKAGSYAIQEQGERLISGFTGDQNTIIGLPLEKLRAELDRR